MKPSSALHPNDLPLGQALLGTDHATRERVVSVLMCLLSYVLSCVVAQMAVGIGVVKPWGPLVLAFTTLPVTLWALWMIRTGRTQGFKDPALMILQNALALFAIAVAYVAVDANSRGLVLLFLPLVIVFGLYTHSSFQSIAVGVGGVVLLALVVGVLAWLDPEYYPPDREIIRLELLSGSVLVLVYSAVQLLRWRDHLRKQREDLKSALQTVRHLAMHDVMTGLINRREMHTRLAAALQTHADTGEPFSVALMDLDHFKKINDTYGHQVGDEVLIGFSRTCEELLGTHDVLARWGGEEFLLLVPNSNAQKVRAMLAVLQGQLRHGRVSATETNLRVSFSAGVCECRRHDTLDTMLTRADQALYAAKAAGRCRIEVAGPARQ